MSVFRCEECGCIENTATSNYWSHKDEKDSRALCSECDPVMGKKWHDCFPKKSASGMLVGADGFLYGAEGFLAGTVKHTEIVGVIGEDGNEFVRDSDVWKMRMDRAKSEQCAVEAVSEVPESLLSLTGGDGQSEDEGD